MVLDQPDAVSPAHSDAPHQESIDLLVDAFRRRGIQLVIDPQHNVIPHVRSISSELNTSILGGNQPWHYAVFAHSILSEGRFSGGLAELPGLNFLVAVGGE